MYLRTRLPNHNRRDNPPWLSGTIGARLRFGQARRPVPTPIFRGTKDRPGRCGQPSESAGNSDEAHILVVGPSWVGDMVMAQSLFKTIKARSEKIRITVLAPKWSEPILKRMPEVHATIEMPVGHGSLQLGVRRRLARSIRHSGFDQAIVLPGSFKSALIPWLAGIPKRTGFVGEQRWGLLNDIRRLDEQATPSNVQRYASLGSDREQTVSGMPPYPALRVNRQALTETLSRFGLTLDQPVLAFCPGAEFGSAKCWPARHFAEVARTKIKAGWQVWIFGAENDQPIAQRINHLSADSCIDLTGKTRLEEVVDLISCARYVVTNDSGLMHVAAATGGHVIALYGASTPAFTPPLTDRADLLNLNLECSPCFERECPLKHHHCMTQLNPGRVLEKTR